MSSRRSPAISVVRCNRWFAIGSSCLTSAAEWFDHNAPRLALLLALLVIPAFTVACQPEAQQLSSDHSAIDTAAIAQSLDSLAGVVARAHQTGDAELFATTWAADGIMSGPGSPPVQGRDAIVEAFLRTPSLPSGAKLTIHPSEIQVMSEEWAYAFGIDSLTYTPQGTSKPVQETYTFLVLIRKTPEGWQTYREVLSANQPSSVMR